MIRGLHVVNHPDKGTFHNLSVFVTKIGHRPIGSTGLGGRNVQNKEKNSDFSVEFSITFPNPLPELSFVLLTPVSVSICSDGSGYSCTLVAILVSKEKKEYK